MVLRFHPEPSAANIASWLLEMRSHLWHFALVNLICTWGLGVLKIKNLLLSSWGGEQGAFSCIIFRVQPA
jgi:hypothetical protein